MLFVFPVQAAELDEDVADEVVTDEVADEEVADEDVVDEVVVVESVLVLAAAGAQLQPVAIMAIARRKGNLILQLEL